MATDRKRVLINQVKTNGDVTQIYPKNYAKDSIIESGDNTYLLENDIDSAQKLAEQVGDNITDIYEKIGSGAAVTVELTQAEYDALPSSKLTNNTVYFIKDRNGIDIDVDAGDVVYDDTNTHLNVSNVQAAIEKLVSDSSNGAYLECATLRSVADKIVNFTGFTLKIGARLTIRFTDTGSANPASGNLTLNVNNSGAKTIVDGSKNLTVLTYNNGGYFCNNVVSEFIYDGTYWVRLSSSGSNEFVGTTAQVNAAIANHELEDGTIVHITDDQTSADITKNIRVSERETVNVTNNGNTITETFADTATMVSVINGDVITQTYTDADGNVTTRTTTINGNTITIV